MYLTRLLRDEPRPLLSEREVDEACDRAIDRRVCCRGSDCCGFLWAILMLSMCGYAIADILDRDARTSAPDPDPVVIVLVLVLVMALIPIAVMMEHMRVVH